MRVMLYEQNVNPVLQKAPSDLIPASSHSTVCICQIQTYGASSLCDTQLHNSIAPMENIRQKRSQGESAKRQGLKAWP